MPSFTDFLFAPWKILTFLTLSGPANGGTGTGASAFCAMKDVGGQIVNSCQVGGYTMPAFIFWASSLILLLFVAASLGLVFQCWRVAWVLQRISLHVSRNFAPAKGTLGGLSGQQLALLRDVMAREPLMARPWRQLEDQLLVSSPMEEVFTAGTPDSILSHQALVDDHVATGFFSAVPGILTGLGLLMTFIAILDGLSHVSVTANMDVQGIGGLINGLSGKFFSSIVAVTCAVSFVFVERIAWARPNAAYRQLIRRIDPLFRRRSTEHLLHQIQAQLMGQAAMQKELAQTLSQLQGGGGAMPAVPPPHRVRT